jgi:hypothetical protein
MHAVTVRYLLCWFALAAIAIANGVLRQATYGRVLPELAAHQLSTVTAVLFSGVFVWWLNRRWPLACARQAWFIGFAWLVATVVFEFGFGHYVAGHSWQRLLADYKLLEGRVWSLFLLWVLLLPVIIHKSARH